MKLAKAFYYTAPPYI